MSNSIHLVEPYSSGQSDDPERSMVIKSFPKGPDHIAIAVELWRLAGDSERASRIQAIEERGFDREDVVLYPDEIKEMRDLLGGLESALKKSILDPRGEVVVGRMADLRAQSRLCDLLQIDKRSEDLARWAVGEGLSRVATLTDILTEALDRGLHVALD